MKIYTSDYVQNVNNCLFEKEVEVNDTESLKRAVSHDYSCALYKDHYRAVNNFLEADSIGMDCDNDHTDNEEEWATVEKLKSVFNGVEFGIHYSRSHMKEKNGKKARPKFHVIFPISRINDPKEYTELKKKLFEIFPEFDSNALDAARLFFGTSSPECEYIKGDMNLTDFMFFYESRKPKTISMGNRNSTMSHYASRIIKKLGDTNEAYNAFIEESNKCEPPLDREELERIWASAKKFYKNTVLNDETYINPEEYNDCVSYKPNDFSDCGQAEVLAKYFSNELRYSPATRYIRYKENYWQETEPGSQAVAQELTRRQLIEAEGDIKKYSGELERIGVMNKIASVPKTKVETVLNDDEYEVYKKYEEAISYYKYAIKRRESNNITSTLKEARPMLEIKPNDLDSDPYLLCTPYATYDLKKGTSGARVHSPEDFITKITSVSPSEKGKDIWEKSLNTIFAKDPELIDYVQEVCGLAAIGKIAVEALIVSYGEGGNGKSTFWNTVFRVLGLYAGKISADALTVNCKRNIKPEMAEAKGKRLLIASESQEGARLDDSIVKQLCSTDEIYAEKKYKDPFFYTPSHTLVLYTNHLPRVSGNDDGIWDRIIVIPFNNRLRGGDEDIKNYADYLYENAGEYVLYWIIEGAKKVIENNYIINTPDVVKEAIENYREKNDWFHHFLEDCCETGDNLEESSSELYNRYKEYTRETNEFTRSTADFYDALEKNNFKRVIRKNKRFFRGIKVRSEFLAD